MSKKDTIIGHRTPFPRLCLLLTNYYLVCIETYLYLFLQAA